MELLNLPDTFTGDNFVQVCVYVVDGMFGGPSCISDATRLGQACVWLWVGRDPREERERGRRRRGAQGGSREDMVKRLRQLSVQKHDPKRSTAMCAGCCKQVHGLVAAPAQPA